VEFKHMVGGSMHYPRFKPIWALARGDALEII
jgi:hypothetical protein